jgi:hypothetical protein
MFVQVAIWVYEWNCPGEVIAVSARLFLSGLFALHTTNHWFTTCIKSWITLILWLSYYLCLSIIHFSSCISDCCCGIHNLWPKVLAFMPISADLLFGCISLFNETKNRCHYLVPFSRLFLVLRRFPIESKGRQKKLKEVYYFFLCAFILAK